ncbi:MAG: HAMP domain-containing histidine kinase [Sulfuriflexus sp.]|nr:HAMP domain-containing histidine kinase [Sulfuriflexus sp.]
MDKRLIIFVVIIVVGLIVSANLLLSVGKTSKVYLQLDTANQLLRTTQEFQIQYDEAHAAITTFMFLGSNDTWEIAVQQTAKLSGNAEKLYTLSNTQNDMQQALVENIEMQVEMYIKNLAPLRKIRQDYRGVIEGVVTSNINQSAQHYRIMASLSNAIEALSQDDTWNKDLIIQLQSAQNRWLRVITAFRALLLLRSKQSEQATLIHVEQFKKEWNEILRHIDDFDIEIQPFIIIADKNQKEWISSLPQVINTHLGKRWRRDLRYMEKNLRPISEDILLSLNNYSLGLAKHIEKTANEIVGLEKQNLIAIFVVMGLIVAFSLTMLLIYTRLLKEQHRKRIDAEHINNMKTEFLSTISHELRTPLNAILGFGQLLEMDPDTTLTEQQRTNVNEINIAGNHLLHLVDEILDLSSIESGNINIQMQKIDLVKILDESISLSKPMASKYGVHINIKTVKYIEYHINADPVRLRQIFINLISNAIKYNKKDGDILISLENKGKMTRINISDTGCGISKKDIEKLFQPFERLGKTNATEGAGIGLMVTKELVESMGGNIGINSKPGKGSTFWVELISA